MKLEIELVPESCFYKNVRSEVSKNKWDEIRGECYSKANYKCEICGGVGKRHPVECHEIWNYEKKGIQKLEGFIALCPRCHEVKHIGLAQIRGRYDEAKEWFMKVNAVLEWEAEDEISMAFNLWNMRSAMDWKVDISLIEGESK